MLAEVRVLVLQTPLFQRRVQDVQQVIKLEWLGDEIGGTAFDRLNGVLHGAVAGHDDRDDARVAFARGFDDALAVDAGEPQIGDEDVERKLVQQLECALSRIGFGDLEALFAEALTHDAAERRLVIDVKEVSQCQYFGAQP